MKIAILGENQWAQAVATLVAEAGHQPKIGKDPAKHFFSSWLLRICSVATPDKRK